MSTPVADDAAVPARRGVDGDVLTGLIARVRSGDGQAWSELVGAYGGLVCSVARAHRLHHADAADVCQTTWLRLAERLDQLRDPTRLPAWLASTARREALRVIAGRRRERAGGIPERPAEPETGPESSMLRSERDARLWRAVHQLPERCQELLRMLAALPELSYREVAELLRMPLGSVGPTRGRCLGLLRERLGPAGQGLA